ncbi:MAG TPA: PocR ligand-binding domain-containing protein [Clostridia bacterium]|nr:PocR ligand-binding domain-containing protein [Clostridia bacterium]
MQSNDYGFDFERAKHSAQVYSRSTGVGCFVIDDTGNTVGDAGRCSFCETVRQKGQGCLNAHLYGSYQAERFGGKYIFFCHMGLVHWVSPLTENGIMKGAMLGGPVMMMKPEEFLLDDLIDNNKLDEATVKALHDHIDEVPITSPEIVGDLSELLFMVASHISGESASAYQDGRDYQEQQSEISEYIRYIKTMGGDDTENYPVDKERELLSLISLGDKAGSRKVLNEILGHIFFSTGGNFEVIKARILELVVLLSRAALEGGADIEQIFGLNYKYLTQIHDFKSVDELSYWLSGIMARFTDCVFNLTNVKHIDVIYKAVDYIKRNYMKKITLEEVASNVNLSAAYFSAVFKEEMKCNFNNYVNKIRIEMSKKLVADNTIPLVDVANLVGYEDQSYFTKVFRNQVGISPGRFRERRGQQ